MSNFGKDQFDAIPIPAELEKTVRRATHRGMANRAIRKAGVIACLVVMLTGLVANIPSIYAAAADIPVLGQIIRLMHVGSGGVSGPEVYGYAQKDEDAVVIHFTTPSGEKTQVPEFSVIQRNYPQRTVLHVHGIAQMDTEFLLRILRSHPAVTDAYCAVLADQHEVGINILTGGQAGCNIAQYADGTLKIEFEQAGFPVKDTAYVLCSDPMKPGKEMANLYQKLAWEGASQIRTEDGMYQVCLGEFTTLAWAQKAQAGILETRKVQLNIQKMHF